jgi:hypothetical protein
MNAHRGQPRDDVWSAPESGTVRDDTSGNQPADQPGRPAPPRAQQAPQQAAGGRGKGDQDDSFVAGEER